MPYALIISGMDMNTSTQQTSTRLEQQHMENLGTMASYTSESTECVVRSQKVKALYRYWNGIDHFYTRNDPAEDAVNHGCTSEGVA